MIRLKHHSQPFVWLAITAMLMQIVTFCCSSASAGTVDLDEHTSVSKLTEVPGGHCHEQSKESPSVGFQAYDNTQKFTSKHCNDVENACCNDVQSIALIQNHKQTSIGAGSEPPEFDALMESKYRVASKSFTNSALGFAAYHIPLKIIPHFLYYCSFLE